MSNMKCSQWKARGYFGNAISLCILRSFLHDCQYFLLSLLFVKDILHLILWGKYCYDFLFKKYLNVIPMLRM